LLTETDPLEADAAVTQKQVVAVLVDNPPVIVRLSHLAGY